MDPVSGRLSPWLKLRWALLLGALFFLVYGSLNTYTATREPLPSIVFAWEQHIPFLSWMIVPYMALDALFVGAFLLCRDRTEVKRLAGRIALTIGLSAAGFLLFPLQFAWPKPATAGVAGALFHLLALDLPYNQCPSLHVSLSFIIGSVYLRACRGWLRWAVGSGFLTIALSTLFVYQHHAIDLVGGAGVGILTLCLLPTEAVSVHRRLAARYTGLAVVCGLLAWLLQGWGWLLLYPALSCLWVALAYVTRNGRLLNQSARAHAGFTRLVLLPYHLGAWLNWLFHRRHGDEPWHEVAPGILLGRRLTDVEAQQLIDQGVTAVLDLAPELTEPRALVELAYCQVPMLDLVPPERAQIEIALAFIQANIKRGNVYVHCALGYFRSAAIVAAYLTSAGWTAADAASMLRAKRPRSVVPSPLCPLPESR